MTAILRAMICLSLHLSVFAHAADVTPPNQSLFDLFYGLARRVKTAEMKAARRDVVLQQAKSRGYTDDFVEAFAISSVPLRESLAKQTEETKQFIVDKAPPAKTQACQQSLTKVQDDIASAITDSFAEADYANSWTWNVWAWGKTTAQLKDKKEKSWAKAYESQKEAQAQCNP